MFKVIFHSQQRIYEVYAQQVKQSEMYGFIEILDLVIGEPGQLLLDVAEEKLRAEFGQVKRCIIPMHCVMRIDEVDTRGPARVTDYNGGSNIMPFPMGAAPSRKE